jgi:hypothetical protein
MKMHWEDWVEPAIPALRIHTKPPHQMLTQRGEEIWVQNLYCTNDTSVAWELRAAYLRCRECFDLDRDVEDL